MGLSPDHELVTEDTPEWLIEGGSTEENRTSYASDINDSRSEETQGDPIQIAGIDQHYNAQRDQIQAYGWYEAKKQAGLEPYAAENRGFIDTDGDGVDDRVQRARGDPDAPSQSKIEAARESIGVQTVDETNTQKDSGEFTSRPDSAEAATPEERRHGAPFAHTSIGKDRRVKNFDNTRPVGHKAEPKSERQEDAEEAQSVLGSTKGKVAVGGGLGLAGLLLLVVL